MQLVIVESPAKSKTINKYLGRDYSVLASFGHVRDLPSKDGSVRPDEDFAMTYEVDKDKEKRIREIVSAAKNADGILLATDPDREGEAISWHVLEVLKQKKALKPNATIKRVVFNEITKKAVLDGVNNPRELDMDLVNAQQARRALDYLVGFTLSPVLWRKLPGSRSAGRVQSVALRLICERENEIEKFQSQEYWDIAGTFLTPRDDSMTARLVHYNGQKCEKFTFTNQEQADAALTTLKQASYTVAAITPKQVRRHPQPPFTTSTMQQEAARKLGFGAKRTMQVAQKLYEGFEIGGETTGLITYMRTDGVYVSGEAIAEARSVIGKTHGDNYVPEKPRTYSKKAKNAQEAHEAIRPTSIARTPESLERYLDADQLKLYTLVWKRMVASQMESAIIDQLSVDMESADKKHSFRATGSQIKFPGFFALYREGLDDEKDEDESRILPEVAINDAMRTKDIAGDQHFTEPPPRYSEASLVKELEKLGIGRPSTYASILSVLQDRGYVLLEKKRFTPEERGRLVTAFLEQFFPRYVQYDYTAELEESLDDISAGNILWKTVLRHFWDPFKTTIDAAMELPPTEILAAVQRNLQHHIFPEDGSGKTMEEKQICPKCDAGKLGLKTGKFGAFLGCSNYPECNFTRQLTHADGADGSTGASADDEFPRILGKDPESGHDISLRKGPYGLYLQIDTPAPTDKKSKEKPKRASLPKELSPADLTLEQALDVLALPRVVGEHPEIKKPITAGIGRFGPYVECNRIYASIPKDEDVLTIGMNRAVTLIAEKMSKTRGGAEALRTVGNHPDGTELAIYSGRYGPYIKHGKVNASLPKGADVDSYTLEEALALLDKKAGGKGGAKKKAPAKKATAKKPAAKKKAPAKKTTTKKAAEKN